MNNYFKSTYLLDQLLKNYNKFGSIVVAFDFDNTVREYETGEPIEEVIDLLVRLKTNNYAKLVCYTCRSGDSELSEHGETWVKQWLVDHNIIIDAYNSPIVSIVDKDGRKMPQTGKIYYNIFLDDKCGLGQSYDILETFYDIVSTCKGE